MQSARVIEHTSAGSAYGYHDCWSYGAGPVSNYSYKRAGRVSAKVASATRAAPADAPARRGVDHTADRHQAPALQLRWRVGADLRLHQLLLRLRVREHDGDQVPAAANDLREAPHTRAIVTWHKRVRGMRSRRGCVPLMMDSGTRMPAGGLESAPFQSR